MSIINRKYIENGDNKIDLLEQQYKYLISLLLNKISTFFMSSSGYFLFYREKESSGFH